MPRQVCEVSISSAYLHVSTEPSLRLTQRVAVVLGGDVFGQRRRSAARGPKADGGDENEQHARQSRRSERDIRAFPQENRAVR